ncbi:D-sedoheptulose 7-phosphate isomerase [Butyrivibrio sp. Su6]|uniref:SIS domain-containing protein n=1 Tax=Butyrivibrio sp. Su6 TaxID=1520810 RepID=UPI00089F54F0|nr:SIS domain-containing protein [Butyrivibrio sp. Su6]SEG17133.1 D-sedoheptulose 7-phosphate isomerase [Butyrivibrio sp. Su6]
MDFSKQIRDYIELEVAILGKLDQGEINRAMNLLEETRKKGSRVYVFGNGGSAATASHMENDFNKGVSEKLEKKYRFQCINANMATIMAIANDNGYDRVFIQQLENRLETDDVIVAISGSGNSENVVKAVRYAKKQGCQIIGMTGYSGGVIDELCDVSLHVPIENMQITEDVHLIINHLMMYVLCGELTGYPVH